jgi:hypothetical protein
MVSDSTDCDDDSEGVNPGAEEACNGVDDDCDGGTDDGGVCPCSVEEYDDHTYLFCEDVVDWGTADAQCSDEDNYQLVIINDADEQDWVWDTTVSYDASRWWWLGYHNIDASSSEEPDGAWEWVDGTTGSYTQWYPHEPWPQPDDYHGNEDCAHIDPSHGFWNDLNCGLDNWYGTEIYYVCESTL